MAAAIQQQQWVQNRKAVLSRGNCMRDAVNRDPSDYYTLLVVISNFCGSVV